MGDTNIDYYTHKGLNTLEKRLNERQLMHSCITVYDICLDHIYTNMSILNCDLTTRISCATLKSYYSVKKPIVTYLSIYFFPVGNLNYKIWFFLKLDLQYECEKLVDFCPLLCSHNCAVEHLAKFSNYQKWYISYLYLYSDFLCRCSTGLSKSCRSLKETLLCQGRN